VEKPENPIYFLSLEKPGRVKRIRFYEGDYISITFKDTKERYKAQITKITADRVEVLNTPLDLSKIGKVTLYNQNRLRAMGAIYLPAGGALYFLADMINPIFSGREAFQVRTGSVVVPLAMIGSGLLLHAFGKRNLKLNKNRYLRILEKI
jgi:translation initiation factor IF-1